MKVFLDTNVLVSALATRGLCADLMLVVLAEHQLVTGEAVLSELRRVLTEKLRVTPDIVRETEEFLRREGVVAGEATPARLPIADPDDAVVLGEAIAAGSDILVTGDRDLLEVADEAPLSVLTPRQFWDRLRKP